MAAQLASETRSTPSRSSRSRRSPKRSSTSSRRHDRDPDRDESPPRRHRSSRDRERDRARDHTSEREHRSRKGNHKSSTSSSRRDGERGKENEEPYVRVYRIVEEEGESGVSASRSSEESSRVRRIREEDAQRRARRHVRTATDPVGWTRDRRSSSVRESEVKPLSRSKTTASSNPRPPSGLTRLLWPVPVSTPPRPRAESIAASTRPAAAKLPSSAANTPRKLSSPSATKVTCLTCLADDIPATKSAKLGCGHRMCHDCLKRIFTMSVTDPQHMPPRCCTKDHIPLKHVDKLFDDKFKVKWNKKYQEYTTRNRIYCPSRSCGAWIKPSSSTTVGGRKRYKCTRCGTKVCGLCNGRWHIKSECPKDEETQKFIEVAREQGWQKCYNCRATVERKEGCNHMTCRCKAQFCICCGAKWKTCECPWFNYENAIDADRRQRFENYAGVGHRVGENPLRYQQELDQRREQERQDEAFARRLAGMNINAPRRNIINIDANPEGSVLGGEGLGQIYGIGNAGGHHLNTHFVQRATNVLTQPYQTANRAAENLLNGTFSGRENPLPPPFLPFGEEYRPGPLRPGPQTTTQPRPPVPLAARARGSQYPGPEARHTRRNTTDFSARMNLFNHTRPTPNPNPNPSGNSGTPAFRSALRRALSTHQRPLDMGPPTSNANNVSDLIRANNDPSQAARGRRIDAWRAGVSPEDGA